MSMIIAEPTTTKPETSIQRRARKQREAEAKARVPSKKEREAVENAARETALSTALPASNKGAKMMAKLGYKPGQALGKTGDARMEPVALDVKEDRGGIGLNTEKKRKVREEMEREVKKIKADEGDYRERVAKEREEKRKEGQMWGAMKVCEKLDVEKEEQEDEEQGRQTTGTKSKQSRKPLKSINVLWRGLVRQRLEQDAEKRRRRELQESLGGLPTRDESDDEDADDRLAMGQQALPDLVYDEEVDEEDPELDEFNELDSSEKLTRLVEYLRTTHQYCFWCKFKYPDPELDGCPGLTEEDHD
jgi:hypothetical protein